MNAYVKAHLLMIDIDKRFEAVIARNPKYQGNTYTKWRVEEARNTARRQRNNLSFDFIMADLSLR